jgi:ubiquitin-protein ligase
MDETNKVPNKETVYNFVIDAFKSAFEDPCEGKMNFRLLFDNINNIMYVEYTGHSDSDFANGKYFFSLELNRFPLAPAKLRFLTESGRFKVNGSISASITELHPESWYQMSLQTLICAIISMFQDKEIMGVGHLICSKEEKILFAKASEQYNLNHNMELVELFEKFGFPTTGQQDLVRKYDEYRKLSDTTADPNIKNSLIEEMKAIKVTMDNVLSLELDRMKNYLFNNINDKQ